MNDKKESVIVETPTEDSKVINETMGQSYPVEQLPKIWEEIDPSELKIANTYPFGSRNLSKMILFLRKVKLTKDQVDHWMDFKAFSPKRNENESFPDYKVRMKFQSALLHYKKEIRAFVMMYAMQELLEKNKQEKEKLELLNTEKNNTEDGKQN